MVVAVVVSYCPERSSFLALLRRLAPQVDELLIIDNSPGENDDVRTFLQAADINADQVALIRLQENLGLAAALNIGIREAMNRSADFVLLSDQDSLPAEDMVFNLRKAYDALVARNIPVGAVGPTYSDVHTRLTYPFQVQRPGRCFYGHAVPTDNNPHVEALTLITSGTLIPLHVLREVGLMREDFFIDQVDIEWCHRARWKGYPLFGTGWAQMHQRMGEKALRVWYGRWRNESAYSPLRLYYRIRNFVALWRTDFIEWRWKLRSSWYWSGIVYAHVFFGKE